MQVLLQSDSNIDGGHPMADHLESVAKNALTRFGERVTRLEAHLSDANSRLRPGAGTIHCMLKAHLQSLETIVVTERAWTAHQAIDGGMRTLKRAVGAAIAKHDPRHQRGSATEPA